MTQNDMLENLVKELLGHEAIKAADAAITLQALRSGTKGYQGPSFKDALRSALTRAYEEGSATRGGTESEQKRRIAEVEYKEGFEAGIQAERNRVQEILSKYDDSEDLSIKEIRATLTPKKDHE